MIKYLRDLNPTEKWTEHNLTKQQIPEVWILYRETDKGLVFAGLHNPDIPDENYADGTAAVLMQSVYQDTMYLPAGTQLKNAAGSSTDILKDKNRYIVDAHPIWIKVWAVCCMNHDITPVEKCYVSNNDEICNGAICGGHVWVENKLHDYVYIVPICNRHNHFNGIMTLTEDTPAVKMIPEFPIQIIK